MRGTIMTTLFSWARTLETIGKLGRGADRWALERHRRNRDHQLASLGIFDGSRFGYRYRLGGMGRLAQYRLGWWSELLDAAKADEAQRIVMRTDQVRWIVGQLDVTEPNRPEHSD
ncbi:MAG: hypothetical protein ACI9MX_003694 [Candidatus Aldehydirespiratoraceae bacterium]|jgi:hypothetical protein